MPSRQTTSNGIERIGSRVQKVTPPARKRRPTAGSSTIARHASRATASGTGSSKPAASQASSQPRSASSKAATASRSRSSVGCTKAATSARSRSAHSAGVASPRDLFAPGEQRRYQIGAATRRSTPRARRPPDTARCRRRLPHRRSHSRAACGAGRTAGCSVRRSCARPSAARCPASSPQRTPQPCSHSASRGSSSAARPKRRATAGTSSRSRSSLARQRCCGSSSSHSIASSSGSLPRWRRSAMSNGMKRASLARILAEDRADRRREGGDVGHHHDDVARPQCGASPAGAGAASRSSSWSCRISTSRCALCAMWKTIERSSIGTGSLRMFGQRHQVADVRPAPARAASRRGPR